MARTTAAMLIEELQKLPPEAPIFTRGYEGGYHDAELPLESVTVELCRNTEWYYGPHEPVSEYRAVKGETLSGFVVG